MKKRALLAAAAAAWLATSALAPVAAQSWPDRPIKVIVPFAAGGSTDVPSALTGAVAGTVVGGLAGYAVFRGLKLVPTKQLFAATSGLIALLAAGMAARGMAYLNQAGYLSSLSDVAWDSSHLISDHSLTGQALAAWLRSRGHEPQFIDFPRG